MHLETNGWFSPYEVKGQCADCAWCMPVAKMRSCEYGQPHFPNAHKCPKYRMEVENDHAD